MLTNRAERADAVLRVRPLRPPTKGLLSLGSSPFVGGLRGSYTSPALAAASYPFVDLPSESALLCKPLPASKFSEKLFLFVG